MAAARAWMELAPAASVTEPATVEVGQPTRLLIQCTLPGKNECQTILAFNIQQNLSKLLIVLMVIILAFNIPLIADPGFRIT